MTEQDEQIVREVARAMCQADGNPPDHMVGRNLDLILTDGERRDGGGPECPLMVPMWMRYRRKAILACAATNAVFGAQMNSTDAGDAS